MALFETLTLQLGPAIAKAILKLWLKDSKVASDISSSIVDILKTKTTDIISQQRGKRQFEEMGEKVAENLLPVFKAEGAQLAEDNGNAVAWAVAVTLNRARIGPELLAERDLEPARLAKYLVDSYPSVTRDLSAGEVSFYQRILIEISEYIMDIASRLPRFEERTFSEVLKRERQLLTVVDLVLEEVVRIRRGIQQANPEIEAGRFEEAYRRAVLRNLDTLELFGVDTSMTSRLYQLSMAYVILSVELKMSDVSRKDNDRLVIMPVDDALANKSRFIIRGLAGSGKTSLLQWIAVRSASRTFRVPLSDWNNTVPFFIRLRQFVDSTLPAPEDFPRLVAASIAGTMPAYWVHNQLNSARAVVLVDGVDELPESYRPHVHAWLRDLVATYSKARFIITSRPHAVIEGWLEQEDFTNIELRPMELPNIYSFIEHWHDAVKSQLQEEEDRITLDFLSEQLQKYVKYSLSIRNLAANPLLCAMLCALHRDRRGQLPRDRIELYQAGCYMLLERRDIERLLKLSDYPRLTYRQKCVLLQDLAYWLMSNGWSTVRRERAQERLSRKLINLQGVDDISGADVLRLFIDRSGMVRAPVAGQIDFAHLTFQEYLAAQEALDADDIGALIRNADDDRWREVIILCVGLARQEEVREELIKALISRGDKENWNRHKLHLLAMACLETAVELRSDVKVIVEQRLSALVPPKNISEAQALASAGELAVPYLAFDAVYPKATSSACIYALSRIGTDSALDILRGYSQDSQVVHDLLSAWDSFETEKYARQVLLSGSYIQIDREVLFSRIRLERIKYLNNITSLDLSSCMQLSNLTVLEGSTNLTSLDLSLCTQLNDLSGLESLTNLISLNLSNCWQVIDLSRLANLANLTSLDLSSCVQLSDLAGLESLTNLAVLNLMQCMKLVDLGPLVRLSNLTSLNLSYCWQVTDLSPLANLSNLASLNLAGCWQMINLSPLVGCSKLISLDLTGCAKLENLGPLVSLSKLTSLNLSGCRLLTDLHPLSSLPNLISLNLMGCVNVSDLSPLVGLCNLRELILYGIKNVEIPAEIEGHVEVFYDGR